MLRDLGNRLPKACSAEPIAYGRSGRIPVPIRLQGGWKEIADPPSIGTSVRIQPDGEQAAAGSEDPAALENARRLIGKVV